MTDEELTLAMAELQEVVRCRCDEAYRDRGLKDPQCECDSADAVKVVADRIKALTKERDALRSALNRIRPIPERILRGIPVRDLAETLAEADSALIKGESHE
jgi:hypothetical protein